MSKRYKARRNESKSRLKKLMKKIFTEKYVTRKWNETIILIDFGRQVRQKYDVIKNEEKNEDKFAMGTNRRRRPFTFANSRFEIIFAFETRLLQ